MMQEFLKFLNRYKIREKLFEIITDNVRNNKISKDELNKVLNRCKYIWNRIQDFIFYLIYSFNLIVQDFIVALKFETIIDEIIFHLNDEQIQDKKTTRVFLFRSKKYSLEW